MLRGLTLLGLGAGLMYFLDPDVGRRRRARVRDRANHLIRDLDEAIEVTTRDLSNRAQGVMAESRAMFEADHASDTVIVDRVRSKLGRVVSHPRAIQVSCRQGVVTVRGLVLASEVSTLLEGIASVRGVRAIDHELEVHSSTEGISELQGGRTRTGERFELFQESWSPTTRLMVGAVAGLALFKLAGRRSPIRLGLGAIGLALAARTWQHQSCAGGPFMSASPEALRGRGDESWRRYRVPVQDAGTGI